MLPIQPHIHADHASSSKTAPLNPYAVGLCLIEPGLSPCITCHPPFASGIGHLQDGFDPNPRYAQTYPQSCPPAKAEFPTCSTVYPQYQQIFHSAFPQRLRHRSAAQTSCFFLPDRQSFCIFIQQNESSVCYSLSCQEVHPPRSAMLDLHPFRFAGMQAGEATSRRAVIHRCSLSTASLERKKYPASHQKGRAHFIQRLIPRRSLRNRLRDSSHGGRRRKPACSSSRQFSRPLTGLRKGASGRTVLRLPSS